MVQAGPVTDVSAGVVSVAAGWVVAVGSGFSVAVGKTVVGEASGLVGDGNPSRLGVVSGRDVEAGPPCGRLHPIIINRTATDSIAYWMNFLLILALLRDYRYSAGLHPGSADKYPVRSHSG
jgi:hypothetical protein